MEKTRKASNWIHITIWVSWSPLLKHWRSTWFPFSRNSVAEYFVILSKQMLRNRCWAKLTKENNLKWQSYTFKTVQFQGNNFSIWREMSDGPNSKSWQSKVNKLMTFPAIVDSPTFVSTTSQTWKISSCVNRWILR